MASPVETASKEWPGPSHNAPVILVATAALGLAGWLAWRCDRVGFCCPLASCKVFKLTTTAMDNCIDVLTRCDFGAEAIIFMRLGLILAFWAFVIFTFVIVESHRDCEHRGGTVVPCRLSRAIEHLLSQEQ
jgi:hypothetical protein